MGLTVGKRSGFRHVGSPLPASPFACAAVAYPQTLACAEHIIPWAWYMLLFGLLRVGQLATGAGVARSAEFPRAPVPNVWSIVDVRDNRLTNVDEGVRRLWFL